MEGLSRASVCSGWGLPQSCDVKAGAWLAPCPHFTGDVPDGFYLSC